MRSRIGIELLSVSSVVRLIFNSLDQLRLEKGQKSDVRGVEYRWSRGLIQGSFEDGPRRSLKIRLSASRMETPAKHRVFVTNWWNRSRFYSTRETLNGSIEFGRAQNNAEHDRSQVARHALNA